MKAIQALLATTILLSATDATHAALVSRDLRTAGDGLITYDTVSKLEWLDLSETINLSYNQVKSELSAGGDFAGWTYASMEQVRQMFDDAGGDGGYRSNNFVENENYHDLVQTVVSYWGTTYSDAINRQSRFISGDLLFIPDYISWGNMGYNTLNLKSYIQTFSSAGPMSYQDSRSGSALVRQSAVPVPAAAWLFGSGLIGLVGATRKRKTAR